MTLDDNVMEFYRDLDTFVDAFRTMYIFPLCEGRIPSKAGISYIIDDLRRSKQTLEELDLGDKKEVFKHAYNCFQSVVGEFQKVEDRDLAQALGGNGELPDSEDPTVLMNYLLKKQLDKPSQFSIFVQSLVDLLNRYTAISSVWGTRSEKRIISNPLRAKIATVISELDKYKIESQRSMAYFVKGVEYLIEFCSPVNNPYL